MSRYSFDFGDDDLEDDLDPVEMMRDYLKRGVSVPMFVCHRVLTLVDEMRERVSDAERN